MDDLRRNRGELATISAVLYDVSSSHYQASLFNFSKTRQGTWLFFLLLFASAVKQKAHKRQLSWEKI